MEAAASVRDRRRRDPVTRGNVPVRLWCRQQTAVLCLFTLALQLHLLETHFFVLSLFSEMRWPYILPWTGSSSFHRHLESIV